MLAAVGAGAVGGALLLPILRQHLALEAVALAASLLMGAMTAALAFAGSVPLACLLLLLVGAAWIAALSTLNAAAQAVLPGWVRGRGLALYLTVFYGAMTGGSLLWGRLAEATSIAAALVAAGACSLVLALVARTMPLPAGEDDLTPSHHWPAPSLAEGISARGGPVLVTVAYRVTPADQPAFAEATAPLGAIRRRDGAFAWGVMADAASPEEVTEWFLVGSWEEHLRQHDRVSVADRTVQARVQAFHRGEAPPLVRHLLPLGGGPAGATP
ncbi:MFS transporter [Roseomonas sp. E05]|nr:MFS transporter [Roseomonas sp. E05]MDJ0388749.1 MFS transporter [Roseomonas sp. E05]